MSRGPAALVIVLGGATTLLLFAHGCGPVEPEPLDAVQISDASDAKGGEAWSEPCVPAPRPEGVPQGWELLTDYDACCGFYAPTAPAQLPPPIRWTACELDDGGLACRQVALDWDAPASAQGTQMGRRAWVHADGTVTLMQSRTILRAPKQGDDWTYSFIADADGPVRQAFLQTRPGRCRASSHDIGDGHYVYRVGTSQRSYDGGALAGEIGSRFGAKGFLHFNDAAEDFTVGIPGIVDWTAGTLALHRWKTPDQRVVLSVPDGLQQREPIFSGSTIFWQSSSTNSSRIKIFTDSTGTRDFISSQFGTYKEAADFGTDGKDMLWIEAAGKPDGGLFPAVSFMTAPYTEDPQAIAPRRLRSEIPNGVGDSPAIVGCGYGARETPLGVRIVRLGDGHSWFLTTQPKWGWFRPLGITCEELFVQYSHGGTSVARVRLDSLGPGDPPD